MREPKIDRVKEEIYANTLEPKISPTKELWDTTKLKYVAKIFNGDSLNDKQKQLYSSADPNDLPYLSSKDISLDDSSINYDNGLRIPPFFSKLKTANKNATLLCIEGGSAGKKIAKTNQKVCFVNKLAAFEVRSNFDSEYLFYSLQAQSFQNQFKRSLSGLIGGVSLSLIKNFKILNPPLHQQRAIAGFLRSRTAELDLAINQKKTMIKLIKEQKQVLVQSAVTKGLDPTAELMDSKNQGIGQIPQHWSMKRVKYVLHERNERSRKGLEPLLMVSQTQGLVKRSEYHVKAEVAVSAVGNKVVYPDDLVFNKLKAHLGVFFKSELDYKGLVSPDYAVYYSTGELKDLKLLEILFRHPAYIGEFIVRATGVVVGLIRLYTDDLFDIKIPIPPMVEQNEIINYIERVTTQHDQLIQACQRQIDQLLEYKYILINNAISGKMKVN